MPLWPFKRRKDAPRAHRENQSALHVPYSTSDSPTSIKGATEYRGWRPSLNGQDWTAISAQQNHNIDSPQAVSTDDSCAPLHPSYIESRGQKAPPFARRGFHPTCDVCTALDLAHRVRWSEDIRFALLEDVLYQSDHGCGVCSTLVRALQVFTQHHGIGFSSINGLCKAWVDDTDNSFDHEQARINLTYDDKEAGRKGWLKFEIFVATGPFVKPPSPDADHYTNWSSLTRCPENDPLRELPRRATLPPTTDHPSVFERINNWTSYCQTNHSCGNRINSEYMPRRVLAIPRTQTRISAALTETTHLNGAPYLTLSHCWGRDPNAMTKTTKASLKASMNFIDVETLPQNLKDAIYITYMLGYNYLWIDSLCIVQDDIEDKAKDIAEMDKVYQNSCLTISVSRAEHPDGTGGCFSERMKVNEFPICSTQIAGEVVTIRSPLGNCPKFVNNLRSEMRYASKDMGANYVTGSRKWCFQERLLSPRVIHFAQGEVVWECIKSTFCEHEGSSLISSIANITRPKGIPDPNPFSLKHDIDSSVFNTVSPNPSFEEKAREALGVWEDIVGRYSHCEVSFAEDSLVALSGIARWLSTSQTLGRYLAGMWSTNLASQLAWHVSRTHRRPRGPLIAPSWSWASVQSPVAPSHLIISDFEVLEVIYQPDELNEFGNAKDGGGVVRIRGPALQAQVQEFQDGTEDELSRGQDIMLSLGAARMYLDTDENAQNLVGQSFWIVCTQHPHREQSEPPSLGKFLVLREMFASSGRRVCKRIGCIAGFIGCVDSTDTGVRFEDVEQHEFDLI